MIDSLRILCRVDLPSSTLRLWDGSGGPYVDKHGDIWRACVLTEDALDNIEMAINAESFTLGLLLSGIDPKTSNDVWRDYRNGTIKGSVFQLLIQAMDRSQRPMGDPKVKFTGRIDNLIFSDGAANGNLVSTITVEVTNRFTMRTLSNGAVFSDVD